MRQIIWFTLLAFTLTSCATRKERAKKYLDKAIALDPTLQSVVDSPIRIIDTVRITDTLYSDSVSGTEDLDKQSLIHWLQQSDNRNEKLLIDNESLRASLIEEKGKNGELLTRLNYTIKPQPVLLDTTIIRTHTVITKTIGIHYPKETIKQRGFFWWSGLVLWIAVAGYIGFSLIKKFLLPKIKLF